MLILASLPGIAVVSNTPTASQGGHFYAASTPPEARITGYTRQANTAGKPAQAQVIAYYSNNLRSLPPGGTSYTIDPETGHITWNDFSPGHWGNTSEYTVEERIRLDVVESLTGNYSGRVFDYGLYDDATGAFWGASFARGIENGQETTCHLGDFVGQHRQHIGRVFFCVLCEGNDPWAM